MDSNKTMIAEFFRSILLCNQVSIQKGSHDSIQYVSANREEVASFTFSEQHDFRLIHKNKKQITLQLQESMERWDELGVVTTKIFGGMPMTVSAKRL